jgi:6,7-dimethyl-8-ribityllumazine synthase
MRILEGELKLSGKEKVAIIGSRFNHIIADRLVEGARDAFLRHGGKDDNLDLILVPGAFEIPFVLDKILKAGKYDGYVVWGL